jgi:hypothetical protein
MPGPVTASPTEPNSRRTSHILRSFLAAQAGPRVSLGELRDALRDRAFGILLVAFALPNLVLVSLPGVSSILGVPLVLLSWQIAYGRRTAWLPRWLATRSFARDDFAAILGKVLPYLERVERLLRPRLSGILSPAGERAVGVACLALSILIALPIPMGNWPPALALCLIGLAMVEKDGMAAALGLLLGAASLALVGGVVLAFVKALLLFVQTYRP